MGSEFEEECLRVHNEYRRKHGAPPLVLDRQICNVAQRWAQNNAAWNRMQHSSGSGYGENIFASMGRAVSGRSAVDAWYDEIKYYRYGSGFSMQTGHFTQVVWKGSTKMGVGRATNAQGWTYVVANYSPPGNYQGQFSANVLPPGNYFTEEPKKIKKEGIAGEIENIIEKRGNESSKSLCDVLGSYLDEHHKNFVWVVTATDSSDGAFTSFVAAVTRHLFWDTTPEKKDVVIFQLKEPTYNANALLETEEFKSKVRDAYLKAQTGDLKAKQVVEKAIELFPALGKYQNYILKTKKPVYCLMKDVSFFREFIGDFYVIVLKGSASFDIKEVTQQVENLQISAEVNKLSTEPVCTIITESGKEQHYYHCKTCNLVTEENALCRFCAKICHKQHEITYFKSKQMLCSCGRKKGDAPVAKCVAVRKQPCSFITDKGTIKVQPWFRCKTCNMDENTGACRFCVKNCHQDHEILEVKFSNFYCDCGLEATFACNFSPADGTCTSVTDKGEYKEQAWFRCKTCNMKENTGVCYICVKVCHNQHEMDQANFGNFVCDCASVSVFTCKACPPEEWCTFVTDKGAMKEQSWFRCKTCSMAEGMGICEVCMKKCHSGHEMADSGFDSFFCDCGSSTDNSCKATPSKVSKPKP